MREAKPLAVVLAVCLAFASLPVAEARPRPAGHVHSTFEANKTFGLGLILGSPTGLSGKYFVGPSTAIDFALGYFDNYTYDARGFYLHADFLWHPVSLVHAQAFELPFYVGVGGLFWDVHSARFTNYDAALGVRVPFGLAFDFNNVPLDIFVEIAPVVALFFNHDYCPDCGVFNFEGAIGFRYYFN